MKIINKVKIHIYESIVESIGTYGSEAGRDQYKNTSKSEAVKSDFFDHV